MMPVDISVAPIPGRVAEEVRQDREVEPGQDDVTAEALLTLGPLPVHDTRHAQVGALLLQPAAVCHDELRAGKDGQEIDVRRLAAQGERVTEQMTEAEALDALALRCTGEEDEGCSNSGCREQLEDLS